MRRRIRWPRTPDCCRPIGSLSKAAFQELKSRIWCSIRRMCIVPPQQFSYLFDNGTKTYFVKKGASLPLFTELPRRSVRGSLVRRHPDRGLRDGRAARIFTRPARSTFWWMPSHLAHNTIEGDLIKGGR